MAETPTSKFSAFKARAAAAALALQKKKEEAAAAAAAAKEPERTFIDPYDFGATYTPEEIQAAVKTGQNMSMGEIMQPIADLYLLAQRGATFGQAPNIVGGLSALMGTGFGAGKEQMLAAEQAAQERINAAIPGAAIVPEIAGGVITGKAYSAPLEAAYPALSGWLGTILQGAGEGALYAEGQDQDVLSGAVSGGVGAGLGRAVATGLNKIGDMLPSLNFRERAASQVAQQMERAGIPPSQAVPTLESEIARLGPEGSIADAPQLRPRITGSINPRASTEALASSYGLATDTHRNVADIAAVEWEKLFPPPRTQGARGADRAMTLGEARTLYDKALDNSPLSFKPDPIKRLVTDAFGDKPIADMKVARDRILSYVDEKAPPLPNGQRAPLTPRNLLEIKEGIDQMIPAGNVQGEPLGNKARRAMTQTSRQINDMLKTYIPDLKTPAQMYAGQYAADAAFDGGYQLGKRGLVGESLDDFREVYRDLSTSEKAAFAEGWRKAKFEKGDIQGIGTQIRRVGPTKANAELEIIDEIFGPDTGSKVVDISRRLDAIDRTNKAFLDRWKAVGEAEANPSGTGLDRVRQTADQIVMASQVGMNKVLGGAFQGAFGRQARALGTGQAATVNDQLLDWASRTGYTPQTTEDALREIQFYLTRGQRSPLDAQLAARAGRIAGATERAMREP